MTRPRAITALVALALLVPLAAVFVFRAVSAAGTPSPVARDVAVSCGESQRAVVRHATVTGDGLVSIECVSSALVSASGAVFDDRGMPVYAAAPVLQPIAAASPVYTAAPLVQRVVEVPREQRVARVAAPQRVTKKKTSWQKRALIIGGSAGAGAGIGALTGGKKGALIGAAVGGGGAAIVDLLRDR